jgi:hypothetical protein
MAKVELRHELLFCAKCYEQLYALGSEHDRAKDRARRLQAVGAINLWLQGLPQLPKPSSAYRKHVEHYATYDQLDEGTELLQEIHFECPEDLYDLYRDLRGGRHDTSTFNDGSGAGGFNVDVSGSYWRIDSQRLGVLWRKTGYHSGG